MGQTTLLDWLTFGAAVLAGGAAAVAAVYTGRMLQQMRADARDTKSLSLIARWNGDLMEDVKQVDGLLRKDDATLGSSDDLSLLAVSSFLTELAIAVDTGIVSEDLLWRFFGPVILEDRWYPRLRYAWIVPFNTRTKTPLFTEIEGLYDAWAERQRTEVCSSVRGSGVRTT